MWRWMNSLLRELFSYLTKWKWILIWNRKQNNHSIRCLFDSQAKVIASCNQKTKVKAKKKKQNILFHLSIHSHLRRKKREKTREKKKILDTEDKLIINRWKRTMLMDILSAAFFFLSLRERTKKKNLRCIRVLRQI